MRDVLYFTGDLINYTVSGAILAFFLDGMLPELFTGRGRIKAGGFMILQFCAVRMAFAWLPYLRQILYGQDMIVTSSRKSIIPLAVSLAVTLAFGMVCYRGSRMRLLSLVTAFYALMELVRFFLYPAGIGSMDFVVNRYAKRFLSEAALDFAEFQRIMGRAEFVWNVLVMLLNTVILVYLVRRYKRELSCDGDSLKSWESAALLFVPGAMGLLFTVMLRCILFYYENEVYSIIKSYPELNVIIPCMSFLCIVSILMSANMLSRVTVEHEKRRQAELYRAQAEELNAHVQDMESVSIRIRGMKHDMKNYIADIKGLFAQMAAGDERAEREVRRYVDSMQKSLEELDMQCQTANPVTDVILARFMRLAKQKGIAFSSDFVYPGHLGIDVFDLSIILNNGLDNAVEACDGEENPFIALHAARRGNMFLLTIENSFHGKLKWSDGELESSKFGDSHGFGLKNIKSCAEKYFGGAEVKARDGRFLLTVMLQGHDGTFS